MWLNANAEVAAKTVSHLGKGGWAFFWRCAPLPGLLLYESTCSPSLWPFSILTAAAIFHCCLFPSHIRSKMVSSFHTELTWAVSVDNFFMMCVPHRTSNLELMKLWSAIPSILTIYVNISKFCEACLATYCKSARFSLNVSSTWFADLKRV